VDGFDLLAGGTMCGVGDRRIVTVTGMYNPRELTVDYFFSESVDLTKLEGRTSLEYERDYFEVEWTCTTAPVAIDGQQGRSCRNKLKFSNRKQVQNQDIILNIHEHIILQDKFISNKSIKLLEKVNWYDNSEISKSVSQYAMVTSIAVKTTISFSAFTISNVFISFLRLTQYIESFVFINVFIPQNLAEFLVYFAEDIVGMVSNPFSGISMPSCTTPSSFASKSLECFYLLSSGETILISTILILLKTFLNYYKNNRDFLKQLNLHFSLSWTLAMLDGLYFNVCIGVFLNLRAGVAGYGFLGYLNYFLSIIIVLILIGSTCVAYIYCIKRHHVTGNNDPNPDPEQNCPSQTQREDQTILTDRQNRKSTLMQECNDVASRQSPSSTGLVSRLFNSLIGMEINYMYLHGPSEHWTGRLSVPIEQTSIFITCLCLVAFHDVPIWQILGCLAVQLAELICIIFRPMFRTKRDNSKRYLIKVLLIICLIFMLTLLQGANDLISARGRYLVTGMVCIICMSTFLLFTFFSSIHQLYIFLKEIITKVCKFSKNQVKKLAPLSVKMKTLEQTSKQTTPNSFFSMKSIKQPENNFSKMLSSGSNKRLTTLFKINESTSLTKKEEVGNTTQKLSLEKPINANPRRSSLRNRHRLSASIFVEGSNKPSRSLREIEQP